MGTLEEILQRQDQALEGARRVERGIGRHLAVPSEISRRTLVRRPGAVNALFPLPAGRFPEVSIGGRRPPA